MTEEHVEIDNGLVLPSWSLKVFAGLAALFVPWAAWVTMTLGRVSYRIDDMADDFSATELGGIKIHVNDLLRRVDRLENNDP